MHTHQLISVFVFLFIDSVHLQQFPPKFPQNLFKIIPENYTNGTLIKSFTVTDQDSTNITLGIFDDFTRQSVSLKQTHDGHGVVTGNVYLIDPANFDFDRGNKEVRLAFTATDEQHNTVTGYVQVYVKDVNDNPPVFLRPAYIYNIPENSNYPSNHNANISATDADDGFNKAFTFTLNATGQSSDLYKDVFSIDPQSGILKLEKSLDYETLSFYQYLIVAVDEGTPPLTGTAEITIKVTDVQDTPPNFQGLPYIFSIKENSSWAGKEILAQDGDRGIPRKVKYEMVNASDECSKLFEINGTTGKFSIKDRLDRDTGVLLEYQGVCRIGIEAEEITGPVGPTTNSTANTTVTVIVEDVDDNVPTFNKSHYEAYIEEGVSNIPMTIVGSTGIEVFDLDQGQNSEFSLMVQYTNGTNFTGIEATPSLVLNKATVLLRLGNGFEFDYETEQTIELLVVATEKINTSLSTTCNVTVNINNTNDNGPKFNQLDYNATIPEGPATGTSVIVVTAEDADLGYFGNLTYTLKGSSKFTIDPSNGTVSTEGSPDDLDRETRDTYYLTMVATDGGNRRDVVSLTVTLSDINDNAPEFLYNTVEMSITENTTEFKPNILVKANDRDEENTPNSEVMYKLICPVYLKTNFTINITTGEIIANQPLDYERLNSSHNGQIHLIVTAYDQGNISLEANASVTINVHDINDNKPKFNQETYNTSIPENAKAGYFVSTVSARDGDATSPNNEVRYYIEKGGSDLFRINGMNGTIVVDLNAKFDRETQDQYNLTIIASDIGTPPQTGTVTLTVTITDINDEKPKFSEPSYEAHEKENVTIGSIVENCNASDVDNDHQLEYDIRTVSAIDGAGKSVNISLVEHMLDIYPNNGSVYVSNSLDRETASQISLTVIVNDTKCAENYCPQTSTALLTVSIEDVNDVPPTFTKEVYHGSVPEDTSVDTIAATVEAFDIDSVGLPPIYTLLNDANGSVTIKNHPIGTITTSKRLDRETQPVLNVTVMASDGLNNSTCIVIVNVTDVNDNAPAFLPYNDTVFMTEGNYTNDPQFIATVSATDADEGLNAIVIYRLASNFDHSFCINDTTGDIWAVGDVDRETTSHVGMFELTIIAENSEKDPENLRNSTKLKIHVLDVNDNHPTFSDPLPKGNVKETEVKPGNQIIQVTAVDPDNGINGTEGIQYVLGGTTNGTRYFYINDTTGDVYANSSMVDNVGTFLLNVTARDGGQPPLVTSVLVYINVEDENNNAPQFHFDNHLNDGTVIYSILECMRNGTTLTKINATDADLDQNGKIAFTFSREEGSDPGPFVINRTSGVIKLNGTVSNKRQPEYKVKINATDNGTPKPLTQLSPTVKILIKDVNDQPPQFVSKSKKANVMENTQGVAVTTVVARDNDTDSVTTYSIKPVGSYYKNFSINKNSGLVMIKTPLDRELTPTVNITVEARDASLRNETCNGTEETVALNDTQIIIVALDDENDSPPVFNSTEFDTGIRKNIKLETPIFDFVNKVSDNDTEINSIHSFEIINITMPKSIGDAAKNAQPCKDTRVNRAVCLSSNGTVTTNMVFEENMKGTMEIFVVARDEAGNSTAKLKIDIIVDSQMARMVFRRSKQDVENIKDDVTRELTNLTGYTFVPDEVSAYMKDDGSVDVTQSVLTFYVKEPKTGRILTAVEIEDLVDRFGSRLIDTRIRYQLVSIEEAFKTPVKPDDGPFKQTMILVGATALEAIIICILVVVACRSQGKFKRKLKAATVTTKDEKDSGGKKTSIVPGSNVYASMTNPILNKEVPTVTEFDRISDTDSQNSLDSNEVGTEGLVPDYQRTEEKEAVMDMYTEDFYQPDRDVDPLQMVLSMHEMESKEQNGLIDDMEDEEDDKNSDFQFDFDNPGFQLETTEV